MLHNFQSKPQPKAFYFNFKSFNWSSHLVAADYPSFPISKVLWDPSICCLECKHHQRCQAYRNASDPCFLFVALLLLVKSCFISKIAEKNLFQVRVYEISLVIFIVIICSPLDLEWELNLFIDAGGKMDGKSILNCEGKKKVVKREASRQWILRDT